MYAWTVPLMEANRQMIPAHSATLIDMIGLSPSEEFHQYTYSCTGHERLVGACIP